MRQLISGWLARRRRSRRPLVVMLGSPYDLAALTDHLLEAELLIWPSNRPPDLGPEWGTAPEGLKGLEDVCAGLRRHLAELKPGLIREQGLTVAYHFEANCRHLYRQVLLMDRLRQIRGVVLGMWGNPPIHGGSGLLAHYLMASGVPVVGCQHGASYATQDCLWQHFEADFRNCSHYFSFGFSSSDLELTYPERKPACRIIPVGSLREWHSRKQVAPGQTVDLVYVPSDTLSIIQNFRVNAHELYLRQLVLFQWLEATVALSVVIKPHPGYGPRNCALWERLDRASRVVVADDPFEAFLAQVHPRAVLLDIPSTPLYQAIGRDTEILLLTDPVLPFPPKVRELLADRVHLYDDVEACLNGLEDFAARRLPKLRGQGFYDKYVYDPDTPSKLLNEVRALMSARL